MEHPHPRLAWLATAQLWLVLDRHAAAPRSLEEVTRLCIAGGVDAVLCRVKDAPREQVRELALPVRQACRETSTPFIMSHDLALACELDADGLQVGVGDAPLAELRATLGRGIALGCSTHSVAEAIERQEDGADYVFLGPIFPTPAKLKYGQPLGIGVVSAALTEITIPVVLIGGITPSNLPELIRLGATRAAAIAALQAQPNPEAAALTFRQAFAAS